MCIHTQFTYSCSRSIINNCPSCYPSSVLRNMQWKLQTDYQHFDSHSSYRDYIAGLWREIFLYRLQKKLFPERWEAFSVHLREYPLLQNPTVLLEGPTREDVHDWTECHPSVSRPHRKHLNINVFQLDCLLAFINIVHLPCLYTQICALELP